MLNIIFPFFDVLCDLNLSCTVLYNDNKVLFCFWCVVFRFEQEADERNSGGDQLLPANEEHSDQQGAHSQHQICWMEGPVSPQTFNKDKLWAKNGNVTELMHLKQTESVFLSTSCSFKHKLLFLLQVLHCTGHMCPFDGEESSPAATQAMILLCEPIPHPSSVEFLLDTYTFLTRHSMDFRFTHCEGR